MCSAVESHTDLFFGFSRILETRYIYDTNLYTICLSQFQVNGRSVEGMRHAEVVALIKAGGKETRLLVVDPETDELFKKLDITPTSTHLKGTVQ